MRSCLSKWFTDPPPVGFPWLYYKTESDTVICVLCLAGIKCAERAFVTDEATVSKCSSIIDTLNSVAAEKRAHERKYLVKVP